MNLISNAQLAADLSAHRGKRIELLIKPGGIEVVGRAGREMKQFIVAWPELERATKIDPLERAIREVNLMITPAWQAEIAAGRVKP